MSVMQPFSLTNIGYNATFDCITVEYPSNVTEVYKWRLGGVSGQVVLTLTLTYTDSSKDNLESAVRS